MYKTETLKKTVLMFTDYKNYYLSKLVYIYFTNFTFYIFNKK